MPHLAHPCPECGSAITRPHKTARFCSPDCRRAFNNRRQQRGAQLYDFFMAMRYERDRAKDEKFWGAMCRIAEGYRDQDVTDRDGRQSWMDPRVTVDENPHLRADRLGKV